MCAMKLKVIKTLPVLALYLLASGHAALATDESENSQAAGTNTSSPPPHQATTSGNAVVKGLLSKAQHWKKQNRMDLAASIWNRVLQSNPNEEEALAEMAVYQSSMEQSDKAKEYLSRLKHVNPGNPAIEHVEKALSYLANKPAWDKLAAGDRLMGQNQFEAAESRYRDALNLYPEFPQAMLGIANSLIKQKKYDAALGHIDQHDAHGKGNRISTRLRSEAYIGKATTFEAAGDLSSTLVFYNKAKALGPVDAWVTLSIARMLDKQGKAQAAQDEIEGMTKTARDPQTLYVGALYYSEKKLWDKTFSLLNKIDARDKDKRVRDLYARAEVYEKTALAKRQYLAHAEKEAMGTLTKAESVATGMPDLISLIVATWMEIKDSDQAIALLERSKPLTPDLQLQYAGVLLQSYQEVKLEKLLREIDSKKAASNIDAAALDQIRIAFAIRKADGLGRKQKTDEGLALLSPLMQKYPGNVDLILARARMLGAKEAYQDALKDVDAALVISPANHEAIRQGAVYSIYLRNYPLADHYLSLSDKDEDRAALYVEAGHTSEAVQNIERAVAYFDMASQLGAQDVPKIVIAPPVKAAETAQPETTPEPTTAAVATPAVTDQKMADNDKGRKARVEAGYSTFSKSGQSGLGNLSEQEVPVSLYIPFKEANRSTFIVKVSKVNLDAGNVAPSIRAFGTNLHTTWATTTPYLLQAEGTSFSVGYQSDSLYADIGISPQGFKTNNTVGGLRWNLDVGKQSNLSVEISRRSVAESVLSFAGAEDNLTRRVWGGVSKTGGQLGWYSPLTDSFAFYAGLGSYAYAGSNLADNTSNHQSASLIYALADSDSQSVSISARLSRASFRQNQNWFTFGHGGYYSPQSDVSFGIPLHLAGKAGRLVYEFNAIGSIANTDETSSPIYPAEPALGAGMNPGTTITSKFSRGIDWTIEYQLASGLIVGNRFNYNDATNNYQQKSTMIYLRYDFDKKGSQLYFPPNPIKPYYITTQGGAGHN